MTERAPERLADLKVLILGLGRFGGGAGAARFFAERGARVTVTDLRNREELATTIEGLGDTAIAEWHLGGHRDEDFEVADWVVVNPAVPPGNPYLAKARRAGARLVTEMALFLRWCPTSHIAGITGSNGKTTTTILTRDMLLASGFETHLGGNVGVSLLPDLDSIEEHHRVVLELSSFQLARLGGRTPRPHTVAITDLSANHLDWHGSEEEYGLAKEQILASAFPRASGAAVLPESSPSFEGWAQHAQAAGRPIVPFAGDRIPAGGVGVRDGMLVDARNGEEVVTDLGEFPLQGRAQLGNLACATALALALGATRDGIRDGVRSFRPVPHRQQTVAVIDGVRYVNDSKATTPRAAACGLDAFGPNVVLLAGGSSKGSSFEELAEAAGGQCRHVVLFGATAPAIAEALDAADVEASRIHRAADLDSAFARARELAHDGDSVLLSPACASYDQFRDYEERGECFIELVTALS